jgi:hypothetical protein
VLAELLSIPVLVGFFWLVVVAFVVLAIGTMMERFRSGQVGIEQRSGVRADGGWQPGCESPRETGCVSSAGYGQGWV